MSYRSEKAEIERLNKQAAAEQARKDRELRFAQQLELTKVQLVESRQDKAEAKADRETKWGRRKAAVGAAWAWAAGHVVDLLIYPLMIGSAAIAVPLAAEWGSAHLGHTGALLPVLSEWGMVAFSIAVHYSRAKHPQRPVWALQVGTWVFAAIGFTIAVLRGLSDPVHGGIDLGMVLGLVSVAGVAAHQLHTAAPRRSAAERAARRIERQQLAAQRAELATAKAAAARVDAARRAAIAHAVAEIDADGTARLVFQPGRYTLHRRGKLRPATVMGLPVDPIGELDASVADEAAAYLSGQHFRRLVDGVAVDNPTATPAGTEGEGAPGGVATADPTARPGPAPIADQGGTRPDEPGGRSSAAARRKPPVRRSARATIPEPKRRTFAQLESEFAAKLENPPAGFDPANAESIRRTLKCGKKPATELRNRYLAESGGSD